MGERTIKKGPGPLVITLGFFLGASSWLLGLHFLSKGTTGGPGPLKKGFPAHLVRILLVGFAASMFFWVFPRILSWASQAAGHSKVLAALALPAALLILQVLWPNFLQKLLPIRRTFLCPQCYQPQDFRFQPVSRQFGFWVTYLCPYCSCLADAWGEQIFFPVDLPVKEVLANSWRVVLPVLAALGSGVFFGAVLSGIHCVK